MNMTAKERVMANRKTICGGCKTYEISKECNLLPIIYKGIDKEQICPCSTCLVKMICRSECCDLTDEYCGEMLPVGKRIYYRLKNNEEIIYNVI